MPSPTETIPRRWLELLCELAGTNAGIPAEHSSNDEDIFAWLRAKRDQHLAIIRQGANVLEPQYDDRQKRCPMCNWEVGLRATNDWWCFSCETSWETTDVTPISMEAAADDQGVGHE